MKLTQTASGSQEHRKITQENRRKRVRAVSPVQQIFDFRSRNLFTCWFQVNKSDKGKGGEGGIFLFILKFLFLDQILQLRWHMKALLSFFQQRYRDPRCCANWLCRKQKCGYIRPENKQAKLSIHSKILIPQPNIEFNVAYESPIIPLSKKVSCPQLRGQTFG